MNEKKRLIVVLAAVLAIILVIVIGQFINSNNSKKLVEEIESIYNRDDVNVIYIGRDDCSYCELFTPVINTLSKEFDFDYTYIDINNLTTKDLKNLVTMFNINTSEFGTPYVVVSKKGNVIGTQIGYTDELNLFGLLQSNNVISQDVENPYLLGDEDEAVASFNKVLNSEEKQLIYIGRPTCGYCQKLSPILEEVSDEYDFEYYYVNTDELVSNQFTTILYKLDNKLNDFGTPYLAVVQNGKKISELPGYVEKETLIEYLEENGIID